VKIHIHSSKRAIYDHLNTLRVCSLYTPALYPPSVPPGCTQLHRARVQVGVTGTSRCHRWLSSWLTFNMTHAIREIRLPAVILSSFTTVDKSDDEPTFTASHKLFCDLDNISRLSTSTHPTALGTVRVVFRFCCFLQRTVPKYQSPRWEYRRGYRYPGEQVLGQVHHSQNHFPTTTFTKRLSSATIVRNSSSKSMVLRLP
jgi:hypothetical protein